MLYNNDLRFFIRIILRFILKTPAVCRGLKAPNDSRILARMGKKRRIADISDLVCTNRFHH